MYCWGHCYWTSIMNNADHILWDLLVSCPAPFHACGEKGSGQMCIGPVSPMQHTSQGVRLILRGLHFSFSSAATIRVELFMIVVYLSPTVVDINNCHMWTQISNHYWSVFTYDKLRVQNVLENALEKLSGLKLQNFPGGACPQTPLAFARSSSPAYFQPPCSKTSSYATVMSWSISSVS